MTSPAVIDLIGVLAYGELVSFERSASDAVLAPSLEDKIALSSMAVSEFHHFEALCRFLKDRGVDPLVAMQPFVEPLNTFHNNMTPRDWLEGLAKTYVGDAIAADFYRAMSVHLDAETSAIVNEVVQDSQRSTFAVERLREAIAQDPKVGGRLALWGRRLMGEMIGQATLVAGSRPALRDLVAQASSEQAISGLVNQLTVAHSRRMDALGLAS
ncbi:unannotated protein [freshwater metagenome]|uniref:Unannotated protein n=1 Tax=freshwater metagenome TaxID=449393 RepID=A0A6J5YT90_9ZZZZ